MTTFNVIGVFVVACTLSTKESLLAGVSVVASFRSSPTYGTRRYEYARYVDIITLLARVLPIATDSVVCTSTHHQSASEEIEPAVARTGAVAHIFVIMSPLKGPTRYTQNFSYTD